MAACGEYDLFTPLVEGVATRRPQPREHTSRRHLGHSDGRRDNTQHAHAIKMTIPDHIPTEIIQRFTAARAWEYMLVPFEAREGYLTCFGAEGRNYADTLLEIEVLSGTKATVEPIASEELQKLLHRYYRSEGDGRPRQTIGEIGSGQGQY